MRSLLIVVLVGLMATPLLAQPGEGRNTELSLSASYQNYSTSEGTSSTYALLFSPRMGFFFSDGFEFEPELLMLLSTGTSATYSLNANVSYNFIPSGKSMPFLLLGYGIANTVPFLNVPLMRTDFSVGVLNVGAGVKEFLSEDIALRFEYRYQKYSGQGSTSDYSYYTYTQKVDTKIHTVQLGVSVLL